MGTIIITFFVKHFLISVAYCYLLLIKICIVLKETVRCQKSRLRFECRMFTRQWHIPVVCRLILMILNILPNLSMDDLRFIGLVKQNN